MLAEFLPVWNRTEVGFLLAKMPKDRLAVRAEFRREFRRVRNADRYPADLTGNCDDAARGEYRRRTRGFLDDGAAARTWIDNKNIARVGGVASRKIGSAASESDEQSAGADGRAQVGGGIALRAGERRYKRVDRVGGIGDIDDIGVREGIGVVARQLGIAGEDDEMAVRADHRIVAAPGGICGAENDLSSGQIVEINFRMSARHLALIDDVVSVGAERSSTGAGASRRACNRGDMPGRQIIGEELAGPSSGR